MLSIQCAQDNTKKTLADFQEYTIDQFMDNEAVFGSSFSHDESSLLIGSDESGIYNAYIIDLASGERNALTTSKDKTIRPVSFFPNDNRILYMSDNNGDEIDHIFLRTEDGKEKDITPDEGAKVSFAGWSDDEKSFYYNSNKRDPQYFDFYKIDIENFESELLFENLEGYSIGEMTKDERYFALTKSVNTNDSDLFIYDSSTKDYKKLNSNLAGHSVADFSVDDKFLYYLTDEGSEFQYLMKYDLASEEKEKVMEEDWDIWYSYFSETGKYNVVGKIGRAHV